MSAREDSLIAMRELLALEVSQLMDPKIREFIIGLSEDEPIAAFKMLNIWFDGAVAGCKRAMSAAEAGIAVGRAMRKRAIK